MDASREGRPRNALSFVVRIGIGGAVLGLVVLRHPGELFTTIGDAHARWVITAALVLFAGIFVSALRWRAYLEVLDIPLRTRTTFRLYLVGTFFNAFLPTGVGGDAYKAMRIGRSGRDTAGAFASVFLDRLAGLVGLAAVGLVGALVELARGERPLRVASVAVVLGASIIVGTAVVLLFGERLLHRRLFKEHGVGGAIRRVVRGIHAAGRHPVAASLGTALGVAFQLVVLLEHVALARALGLHVSVAALAGVIVLAQMATLIPLTVNGLGFRESAYVWALHTFGVAHADARAFAILVLAILLTTSLAGGVVYVIAGGDVPAVQAMRGSGESGSIP